MAEKIATREAYGSALVDLAEKCAITWDNYSGYMMDKIHPTTAGMELISDCIEAELVAYYTENPPHTHTYTPTITAPTCTQQGYTTYTCPCGSSYTLDYAAPTGHSYENGICTICKEEAPGPYAGKTIACITPKQAYERMPLTIATDKGNLGCASNFFLNS